MYWNWYDWAIVALENRIKMHFYSRKIQICCKPFVLIEQDTNQKGYNIYIHRYICLQIVLKMVQFNRTLSNGIY